jgi:tetratricopeptide (TPR) repeat protein
MSKNSETKWIVKDSSGKIFGPFSSAQVLVEIDKGYFIGEEMIATYPGGSWRAISKAPEFYDRLLDVLAQDSNSPVRPTSRSSRPGMASSVRNSDDEVTQIRIQPPGGTGTGGATNTSASNGRSPSGQGDEDDLHAQLTGAEGEGETTTQNHRSDDSVVIELTDLKSLELKERLRSSKAPLMVVGATLLILVLFFIFMGGNSADSNRIHLLAPRANQPPLAEAKVKEKLRRALTAFQTDTFSGYQRAQNELVEALEGAPPNPETQKKRAELASTLCLVYRELWPFAFQDSRDAKTISLVMQQAKKLDPGGLNGSLCEIIQLMVTSRYRDAQGLTDSMLAEENQAPVLFEIRGDLYNSVQDYGNAAAYFTQARQLWPGWLKISVDEARARIENKQFPQAMQLLKKVLAAVPSHPVAKIELGLIEFGEFGHDDQALNLLRSALESGEKVTRPIASNANLGMAQIFLKKNEKKKSLQYAKKAYALNTANTAAKNLVVQLAGANEIKSTKVDSAELMAIGQQHMRSGDYFAAQAEFKAAFEADPKNGTAAMYAGKCLWSLNQSEDAMDWLKKAYHADPNLIAAYVELADDYAQRFDYHSATNVLQQVQRIAPQSYEVYRGFAVVELRRNNFQAAVTFAQRALHLYETDIDTLIIMGKAHLGLQEYQDAQRFAGKAIELDYNNTAAQSLYAKIESGLHGVDAAAAYLRQQISRYGVISKGQQVPQAAIDFRVTLGEIFMQDERYEQAEEEFRQAIALDPNNKEALVRLGKVMQAENRAPDSLVMFLKAAVLDPSDADPIFQSALVYSDVGKLIDASNQFQRVIRINARYPRAHIHLGEVYLRQGDAKKALEESLEERRINPELAEAYGLAGEAYYALGQYSNCASEYQKAVAKKLQNSDTLIKMARCYRLTGALDSAQSLLRQAQAAESGNANIYKEQGAIFHTKGMGDEAIQAYETYLRLVPNAVDKAQIENEITKIQSGDTSPGQ